MHNLVPYFWGGIFVSTPSEQGCEVRELCGKSGKSGKVGKEDDDVHDNGKVYLRNSGAYVSELISFPPFRIFALCSCWIWASSLIKYCESA